MGTWMTTTLVSIWIFDCRVYWSNSMCLRHLPLMRRKKSDSAGEKEGEEPTRKDCLTETKRTTAIPKKEIAQPVLPQTPHNALQVALLTQEQKVILLILAAGRLTKALPELLCSLWQPKTKIAMRRICLCSQAEHRNRGPFLIMRRTTLSLYKNKALEKRVTHTTTTIITTLTIIKTAVVTEIELIAITEAVELRIIIALSIEQMRWLAHEAQWMNSRNSNTSRSKKFKRSFNKNSKNSNTGIN